MQLKHNPFRQEQIDAILSSSGVRENESPIVLDLGCGPGILGRLLTNERPLAQYVGIDGDPLMLMAMQRLLHGRDVRALQVDLRKPNWSRSFKGHFDLVVSLTALHWLSQEHQKETYRAAIDVLKPGGKLRVGRPYQPEDPEKDHISRGRLGSVLHYERSITTEWITGKNFGQSSFTKLYVLRLNKCPTESTGEIGLLIPFEGSDYRISFALTQCEGTSRRCFALHRLLEGRPSRRLVERFDGLSHALIFSHAL